MASSDEGTSSGFEYQVFLSFKRSDTCHGFTDFLFHSLIDAGIYVFQNNKELCVGERINGLLQQEINDSKIYIPIFSQNYASSQRCLGELTQILSNTSNSKDYKEILPIYFGVEPDDVKLKTVLYSDAILSLQREKELSNEQVDIWRKVLMEVGAIKGWEVKKHNSHGKMIKLIAKELAEKLKVKHRPMTKHLVGFDGHVASVLRLLDIDSDDVRLIKIYGMGGIGKTTLAKVIFNKFYYHFGKYSCFLENIREKSSRANGLIELQKEFLDDIDYRAGTRSIDEIEDGMKMIGEALCDKKVLLVLDDVDNSEQVVKLVGESTLYPGSRILITTRNRDVLQINNLKYFISDYEMEAMSSDVALQLFSQHAFYGNFPLDEYCHLARQIVFATGALPLTLEVIGSFLRGKNKKQWEETLDKLRRVLPNDVFGTLKISYDALSYEHQQIFLDIACFLIGEDMTNAIYMWRDCGFFPDIGVDVLQNMSLVKIRENNKFSMHDQLRDLGRGIVYNENPINPGKRSRIWIWEEVLDVLNTEKMNKKVEALYFETNPLNSHNTIVQIKEIGRFEHLRFLKLHGGTFVGNLATCLPKLRWFSWYFPPHTDEWTNIYLKNVVVLEYTGVDSLDDLRLQDLIKMASKLKVLTLKSCHDIMRTPDFSGCPNLERLSFEDCSNLKRIDGSIGKLKYLIDLKIDRCFCLKDLPKEIGDLVNLQNFFVQRCKVKKLPDSIWKLKSLRELKVLTLKSCHGIMRTPDFSGCPNLKRLHFEDCSNLKRIDGSIGKLNYLIDLKIDRCFCLKDLPEEIGDLVNLQNFFVQQCKVKKLPDSIWKLKSLSRLHFSSCFLALVSADLWELPSAIGMLPKLEVLLVNSPNLKGELPFGIEVLPILRVLNLSNTQVSEIPKTISMLPYLNTLELMACHNIQELPVLPTSLTILRMSSASLRAIPDLSNLTNLVLLDLMIVDEEEINFISMSDGGLGSHSN